MTLVTRSMFQPWSAMRNKWLFPLGSNLSRRRELSNSPGDTREKTRRSTHWASLFVSLHEFPDGLADGQQLRRTHAADYVPNDG